MTRLTNREFIRKHGDDVIEITKAMIKDLDYDNEENFQSVIYDVETEAMKIIKDMYGDEHEQLEKRIKDDVDGNQT